MLDIEWKKEQNTNHTISLYQLRNTLSWIFIQFGPICIFIVSILVITVKQWFSAANE